MILPDVTMLAHHYRCNECGWDWYSIAKRKPDACPNRDCRTRQWDGKKQKRKPKRGPGIELPKPKRIREDMDDEF